jgi:hypothetical protein
MTNLRERISMAREGIRPKIGRSWTGRFFAGLAIVVSVTIWHGDRVRPERAQRKNRRRSISLGKQIRLRFKLETSTGRIIRLEEIAGVTIGEPSGTAES